MVCDRRLCQTLLYSRDIFHLTPPVPSVWCIFDARNGVCAMLPCVSALRAKYIPYLNQPRRAAHSSPDAWRPIESSHRIHTAASLNMYRLNCVLCRGVVGAPRLNSRHTSNTIYAIYTRYSASSDFRETTVASAHMSSPPRIGPGAALIGRPAVDVMRIF